MQLTEYWNYMDTACRKKVFCFYYKNSAHMVQTNFALNDVHKPDLHVFDGGEGGGGDEVDPGAQSGGHGQLLRAVRHQLPLRIRVLVLCIYRGSNSTFMMFTRWYGYLFFISSSFK